MMLLKYFNNETACTKCLLLISQQEMKELVKTQQYYAMMRRKFAQNTDSNDPLVVTLFSSSKMSCS